MLVSDHAAVMANRCRRGGKRTKQMHLCITCFGPLISYGTEGNDMAYNEVLPLLFCFSRDSRYKPQSSPARSPPWPAWLIRAAHSPGLPRESGAEARRSTTP